MKQRKKFQRNTITWQFFEKLFFLKEEQYPYQTKRMKRGSAINLTQGLNCCNVQWAEEQQMPLGMLTLSAKAKRVEEGEGETWVVEISTNYRQQGLASPAGKAKSDWMLALLDSVSKDTEGKGVGPVAEDAPSAIIFDEMYVAGSTPPELVEEAEDPMEKLLREQGYVK